MWSLFYPGGLVRRTNLAIKRHARKIYTRAMFEEFGCLLIKGTAYNVTEVEKMRKYVTTHNNASKREKWSRVFYEVVITEDGSEFICECGQFEHTGMLCCHVLWVMVHRKIKRNAISMTLLSLKKKKWKYFLLKNDLTTNGSGCIFFNDFLIYVVCSCTGNGYTRQMQKCKETT